MTSLNNIFHLERNIVENIKFRIHKSGLGKVSVTQVDMGSLTLSGCLVVTGTQKQFQIPDYEGTEGRSSYYRY